MSRGADQPLHAWGCTPKGPREKASPDFKAMFNMPLPQDAIDALAQLFGLDKEDMKAADSALAMYLGPSDIGCQEEIAAA